VQFAAATAINPEILIIDEVMGAGDAYFAAKSTYRMQKLARSGCTLLLVSHSWQQVQQFCERVIWLMHGRVHADGASHEILAEYEAYVARQTAKLQENPSLLVSDPTISSESATTSESPSRPEESSNGQAADAVVWPDASIGAEETSCAQTEDSADASDAVAEFEEPTVMLPLDPVTSPEFTVKTEEVPAQEVSGAAVDIDLPEHSGVAWVAEILRRKEHIAPADEHVDTLLDGKKVYRVAGKKGLRFHRVSIQSNGQPVTLISTGDSLSLEFDILMEEDGEFRVSYWIHLFTIDGRRVARLRSPADCFTGRRDEVRRIVVHARKFLLGGGDYLVSFSMFDQSNTTSTVDGTLRYEMLARSFQIKVRNSNDSDPPVMHHPAAWFLGNVEKPLAGELRSEI
jgi:hypothetical protein